MEFRLIISPRSKRSIIIIMFSLAKPARISWADSTPNKPRTLMPIINVNAGPISSLYNEIIIKAITTRTNIPSKFNKLFVSLVNN